MAKKYSKRELSILYAYRVKERRPLDYIVNKLKEAGFERSKNAVKDKLTSLGFNKGKKIYESKWDAAKSFLIEKSKYYKVGTLQTELRNRFGLEVSQPAIYSQLTRMELHCKNESYGRQGRRMMVRKVGGIFQQKWGNKQELVWFVKYKANKPPMVLHRWNWEQQYGEIPKTHVVIFKDGDKNNIKKGDCSNLKLMPKSKQTIGKRWRGHVKQAAKPTNSLPKVSILERYLKGEALI